MYAWTVVSLGYVLHQKMDLIILTEGNEDRFDFNTIVVGSIAITVVLLLLAPMLMVIGKDTSYSAYESDSLAQLSEMRCDLGDDLDQCTDDSNDLGYFTANTMSTPMLVNDWKDPHRTMLVVVSPEKPIDETAADAIYDFVTEKGGKVIVAADNTNANRLASKFGVSYFDKPLLDQNQHWLEYNDDDTVKDPVWQNVWSVASVENDVNEMEAGAARKGCSDVQISNNDLSQECRIPVMFRSPTGIRFEPTAEDLPQSNPDTQREVNVLATASSSAFIDIIGNGDSSDARNPAPGDLALMVRIDYPGISVFDKVTGKGGFSDLEEIDVTGSIVFVSDDEAFSDRLWDFDTAALTGMRSSCEGIVESKCWMNEINDNNDWNGNSVYFQMLVHSMMEFDNFQLSSQVRQDNSNFRIVFDESRHVTGTISAPFVAGMSTVVLLTSNTFLKWLVVLNVGLLLLVSMMVIPEKENWRHVFDLTRFNQRPKKLDPSTYRLRVKQSLFTKVRVHHDLTRDQMASKPPAEVQAMIGDPRLVELAYSQSRTYSPQELRQLMVAIRKWGKVN
ncbi:MAG: hypothetical protein ACJZ4T_05380 [Candidatus Thalassarchaeaceae archaeon]|uniref:DUF4350 domain-containing protein n=1 Tax=uncultured Poseidoniia archaeon TaxID=1697135 RepID=A0A1B1TB01_9ARCH|nr:hypothetical protein [uncultured Candidatus Thalassoarchaea sp.]